MVVRIWGFLGKVGLFLFHLWTIRDIWLVYVDIQLDSNVKEHSLQGILRFICKNFHKEENRNGKKYEGKYIYYI